MGWTEDAAARGSEAERVRKLATTDAVARAQAALERARDAGMAAIEEQSSHRCLTCGSLVRVVSDREGTSYYTPVARSLAEAVLAADAMLADLDARGGPSRTVELALWDQIVQLARRVLG